MSQIQNTKQYDLEERTFKFAARTRRLVKQLPKTIANLEDSRQLVRSTGSVHANYIEANESLSRKDYFHRVRICRKEAKESRSWLALLDIEELGLDQERKSLMQEATELMKIFGSILEKSK